jgi:hypothetical protein
MAAVLAVFAVILWGVSYIPGWEAPAGIYACVVGLGALVKLATLPFQKV